MNPVYKDHPREARKVVFIGRWSLYTGSFSTCFNEKLFSRETKNVVFVDRWSFYTGGHYSRFDRNYLRLTLQGLLVPLRGCPVSLGPPEQRSGHSWLTLDRRLQKLGRFQPWPPSQCEVPKIKILKFSILKDLSIQWTEYLSSHPKFYRRNGPILSRQSKNNISFNNEKQMEQTFWIFLQNSSSIPSHIVWYQEFILTLKL